MKPIIIQDSSKLFFTSDLHLDHLNILTLCNRPFKDKGHMNEVIINNWNSVIADDDIIFHLGDFCLGSKGTWTHFINRLNGIKIFIKGNHDREKDVPDNLLDGFYDGFVEIAVKDYDIPGNEQRIVLCHYPMLSWHNSHKGTWQLFGHWHSGRVTPHSQPEIIDYVREEMSMYPKLRTTQYDVGVDGNNFAPVSYNQVKKIINEKNKTNN